MSGSATKTNIEEIAKMLTTRKNQRQRIVLFLGSRAGGLFGNEFLYDTLKQFSLLNFDTLSSVEKFRECYYVLSKHFTESERHNVLVGALATLRYREEDKLLAELVKAELFEVIISTNIDTLLEEACSSWGLRTPSDYQVFIPDGDGITKFEQNKPKYSSIVKVFGDLKSRHYSIAGEAFNLHAEHELQKFLTSVLTQGVLLVGYDPVWDHAIEPAFPTTGGTVWYINETQLLPDTHLASIFDQRNGKFFQNDQGSYSSFFRSLYVVLGEEVSTEKVAAAPDSLMPQSLDSGTKRVFISYSPQDRPYLERLITHLKGYMLKDAVDIWDDTKILSSKDWKEEFKRALMQAKVAILLVSSNFLSSERKNEIPILLEAADKGVVKLLPVIIDVSASSFDKDLQPLYEYQVVNSVSVPLMGMELYKQEIVWNKLAGRVYNILSS